MLKFAYKFITPIGTANKYQILKNRVIGRIVNYIYRIYIIKKIKPHKLFDNKIIISLTTYPPRIEQVYYCLQSLLRQSVKPYKVILWLAESQFPNKDNDLPKRILKLKKYGLDIKYCEDFKSYKKIALTAKEYTNYKIVTADDDTLYPEDWLEKLIKTQIEYPNCVICYRAHEITFDNNKEILPYKNWNSLSVGKKGPSMRLVPIGVGGILYPNNFFENIEFCYEDIKKLAPTTDDIWLKIIGIIKNIKTVKVNVNSKEWFTVLNSQKNSLKNINVETSNANDLALKKLISFYNIDCKRMFEEENG